MPISPKSCPDFSQNLPLPRFEADWIVSSDRQDKTHHKYPKSLFTSQVLLDLLSLMLNISF